MAFKTVISRRGVLAAGAASVATAAGVAATTAGVATVAGCGDGGCEQWSEEYEPKAAPSPASLDGKRVLAALADIEVGQSITARTPDGEPIIVSRPTATTAIAFSAKCTHHGCVVNPDGDRLRCPPHDGYFSASTGEAQDGPPKKPLPRVSVTVADGKVVLS